MIREERSELARVSGRRNCRDSNDNRKVAKELHKADAIRGAFMGHGKGNQEAARSRGGSELSGGRQREREGGIWGERGADIRYSRWGTRNG